MENVRIDKGMKRTVASRPVSPKADLGSWVIPDGLKPQEVLDRYLSVETTSEIAAQYGLSRKALVKWLREVDPQGWKNAQIIRAICRKENADEGLEAAADPLSLARARELLRSGQWDLERLDAKNYGQQTSVKVEHTVDLGDRLRRARDRVGRVLEHGEGQDVQDAAALPVAVPSEPDQS